MRYLLAVARAWVAIIGYFALTVVVAGGFVLLAIPAHYLLGVATDRLAAIVFGLTFVTTGALVVEHRS